MRSIESHIEKFILSTISNYEARLNGDYVSANKHFKSADRLICEIKQEQDWIDAFIMLLNHNHISVRIRAATILLPFETNRAKSVLRKCRSCLGEEGFIARMVIEQWNSGSLKFPVFKDGNVFYE